MLAERGSIDKEAIVKSRHTVRTTRPLQGLVAFARAVAMALPGTCSTALHQAFATNGYPLDRAEDRMHPGEGSV